MEEFKKLYKKINGTQQLIQYAKAHLLFFAIVQTLLLGVSKKALEIVRLSVNNKLYRRLKRKNKKFVEAYVLEHENDNFEHIHSKVVWTIWLQGMDQAPAIVKKCYESMCKNLKDREIVVITEDNFSQYVNFPDYIMEKYRKGIISKVHFADLLRIELLTKHGGTWLDGTVFISDEPKQNYLFDAELFLFQTLKPGLDGQSAAISSWFMTASSNNKIILLTRALLHNYWKNHNYAVDYFILHNFFQIAIETYPEEWEKVVPFCNSTPHILLLRLFEPYKEDMYKAITDMVPVHKLSYKFTEEQMNKEGTYFSVLFKESEG